MCKKLRCLINKKLSTIACAIMAGLSLSACSDNDGIQTTGIDGRPSSLLSNGQVTVSFVYENGRLAAAQNPDGSSTLFKYQEGELSRLWYTPAENMADGNGWVEFSKISDNLIQISSGGEPSADIFHKEEMELDANGLPVRIVSTGFYQLGYGGSQRIGDGIGSAYFTFDTSTRLLTRLELYDETSALERIYTFEYDSAPGNISGLDLPLWFLGWWNYRYAGNTAFQYTQFLNYRNNISRITVEEPEGSSTSSIHYLYNYNENGYPFHVSLENGEGTDTEIRY